MSTSAHFTHNELKCQCQCGLNNMSLALLNLIEHVRFKRGKPIFVSSGSRCIARNKAEGGKINSAHLSGQGIDIKYGSGRELRDLLKIVITMPFIGIGIHKDFIHLDIKSRWHGQDTAFPY